MLRVVVEPQIRSRSPGPGLHRDKETASCDLLKMYDGVWGRRSHGLLVGRVKVYSLREPSHLLEETEYAVRPVLFLHTLASTEKLAVLIIK